MTTLLLVSSLFFVILYHTHRLGWKAIEEIEIVEAPNTFSVIIPVRNEEENVLNVLNDLSRQEFNNDRFEVIVVDDHSDDRSMSLVEDFKKTATFNIRTTTIDQKGKKFALTKGIEQAKNDIILTLDADCRLTENWIKSFDATFRDKTAMVVGPVWMEGKGLFSKIQTVEYAALNAFGALTLNRNNPTMCSGANLAFKRIIFFEVGGYRDNIHLPSGDDEFLLYKVMKTHPKKVIFLKNSEGVVKTKTVQAFGKFIDQRKRWTGKWRFHSNNGFKFLLSVYFLDSLIVITSFTAVFFGIVSWKLMLLVTLVRGMALMRYIDVLAVFFKFKNYFIATHLLQILYPFYLVFMCLNSIFGIYEWKGRKSNDR